MDASDTTDDDEMDASEDALAAAIAKEYDPDHPSREWLKHLTEEQYLTFASKDSYAFLHGHEDEVIQVLYVGRNAADYFKTLSVDDVKTVYQIIIEEVEQVGWSMKEMAEKLLDEFPQLTEFEAKRIIKTETARVLFYAKEMEARRDGQDKYNYGWVGPLDYRTTPMCYYLQTGELRDSDLEALHRAGHDVGDLPKIPAEGMPLDQLKETCVQVASAFGSDMISDWVMHINCRHTFARGSKLLEPEAVTDADMIQIAGQFEGDEDNPQMYPSDVSEETVVAADAERDSIIEQLDDDYDAFIFPVSINGLPSMYIGSDDNVPSFVFNGVDERGAASYAHLIQTLRAQGLDEPTIAWGMDSESGLGQETVGYIMAHTDAIMDRAAVEGWLE